MLHEDQYTFPIIPRSVLLRMTNSSNNGCRENLNTLLYLIPFLFLKSSRLWDNVENTE
jgi:hypothetical protein